MQSNQIKREKSIHGRQGIEGGRKGGKRGERDEETMKKERGKGDDARVGEEEKR